VQQQHAVHDQLVVPFPVPLLRGLRRVVRTRIDFRGDSGVLEPRVDHRDEGTVLGVKLRVEHHVRHPAADKQLPEVRLGPGADTVPDLVQGFPEECAPSFWTLP
jgi:hypothetical protein